MVVWNSEVVELYLSLLLLSVVLVVLLEFDLLELEDASENKSAMPFSTSFKRSSAMIVKIEIYVCLRKKGVKMIQWSVASLDYYEVVLYISVCSSVFWTSSSTMEKAMTGGGCTIVYGVMSVSRGEFENDSKKCFKGGLH